MFFIAARGVFTPLGAPFAAGTAGAAWQSRGRGRGKLCVFTGGAARACTTGAQENTVSPAPAGGAAQPGMDRPWGHGGMEQEGRTTRLA